MSRCHASFHLVFGHTLFIFPDVCNSIPDTFLSMCSSSLLITCPYQFNRLLWSFYVPLVVPQMCSFLISYLRVTSHIHRSILISFTSIRFSRLFVAVHISAQYSFASLITVLYAFPFSFAGILCNIRSISSE